MIFDAHDGHTGHCCLQRVGVALTLLVLALKGSEQGGLAARTPSLSWASPGTCYAFFPALQACLSLADYERARDFLVRAQREQPFNHDINNALKQLAR